MNARGFVIPAMILLVLHSIYIYFSFLQVPLNSDHANQVLEAADILSGNVLLHGWNLTGVSFYLSEIPFYVLGTAIAGVDTYAYIIAASVMVIILSLLGFVLSGTGFKGRNRLSECLLYLGLTGFPTLTCLGYLRGHCAIFIYFFILLLCLDRVLRSDAVPVRLWVFIGVLIAFGCMSDMQLLIIGIIPILLFCGVNLLRNDSFFDRKKTAWLGLISIAGTGIGVILDALLMYFGRINKNSFLNTRSFADLDRLKDKFLLLGKGILDVFGFDLPGTGWSLRSVCALCFVSVILTAGVLFLLSAVKHFLEKGGGDPISVVLSFSLAVMCLICFFTDIYTDETSARYISYMPFAAGVLICRSLEKRSRKFRLLPFGIIFLAAGLIFLHPVPGTRVETPQDRLAAFLTENRLTEGYADFWNASHTTVASNEQVKVRAIRGRVPVLGQPDHLEMQNWFCKSEWYETGTPDFIVFDGSGYLHISEDVVTMLLGEPGRILSNDEYVIYCYDRDLSSEIILPASRAR